MCLATTTKKVAKYCLDIGHFLIVSLILIFASTKINLIYLLNFIMQMFFLQFTIYIFY